MRSSLLLATRAPRVCSKPSITALRGSTRSARYSQLVDAEAEEVDETDFASESKSRTPYIRSQEAIQRGLRYGFGQKPVYMPSFTIQLIYQENPNEAKFHVPLNFSKMDLHDYLYHAYGLKVKNIRSWVTNGYATKEKRPSTSFDLLYAKAWRWVEGKKYMIVELHEPFIWPKPTKGKMRNKKTGEVEEVDDFRPWGKQLDADYTAPQARRTIINTRDRALRMKMEAEEILSGKRKWRPMHLDIEDSQRNGMH
ncbi:hypothetical protein EJ05DRAFT_179799 [Pseudovirgaria hyperparasitica]|uniref:Large ribosomal subunit protein uL23m n=1 Tax=Pseudovirgaria hyperparasitica TaxID=470096 RepID=A0A6A6WIX9_9PEZI|nr:uncharacterized protein EJ05DRAFT_179799 [Pseudovirgaria hyperparasitica]KAF2761667.1 hypothetical protein EJ05DRAFT_179799 [Pseudovirgaria hyperparasitica]